MIPKNIREGSVAVGLDGEKAMFTIAANGKAFRTLIDGLYSNKIRAVVRELCSNAADSHVAAHNSDPFLVQVPTTLDPVFRVRDYGVGLSHEDVMHLYTTIFQSTKEETNEQTGQLGLGSKSPFAYTDSFQVTVWMDGQRRQYLAYLETDGVPSITHVSTDPSDEPRGLEVSFPVERHDVSAFGREMQFVGLGYKNPPTVEGMELKVPTPRLAGSNWEIYPNNSFSAAGLNNESLIRMGTAVYPSGSVRFPHLGYGWIAVVEIPIGTADVTASRESLSFDPETLEATRNAVQAAYEDLKTTLETKINAAATRVERARLFYEHNGVLDNIKGSVNVSLLPDNFSTGQPVPAGCSLEKAAQFGRPLRGRSQYNRFVSGMEVQQIERVRIAVNDTEVHTTRRYLRTQAWGNLHAFGYVLDVEPSERQAAIDWIKTCWEIDDGAFVLISSLADVPVVRRKSTSQRTAKKAFDAKTPWLIRNNGVVSSAYGQSSRGQFEWPERLRKAAQTADITLDWDKTLFLTTREAERLQAKGLLDENLRLDTIIKKKLLSLVNRPENYDRMVLLALHETMGVYHSAVSLVVGEFFPKVKSVPTRQDAGVLQQICNLANVDLQTDPTYANIRAEVDSLSEKFPLLFNQAERKHYEHYIKAVQATTV